MIYEMEFEHEGEPYYLAGKKEVRDDPGFDLWEDTTTLNVQLHKGSGTDGPVVGAGVLKLSKEELVKLLRTLHPINAQSNAERFNLVANFGAFFLGELWDTYKNMRIRGPKGFSWPRYSKLIAIIVALAGLALLAYYLFFA